MKEDTLAEIETRWGVLRTQFALYEPDDDQTGNECSRCGVTTGRDEDEPTPICHNCAHEVVDEYLKDVPALLSHAATLAAEVTRLREACAAALGHAGQCLCCRANYEHAQRDGADSRVHDDDCYIAKARAALAAGGGK